MHSQREQMMLVEKEKEKEQIEEELYSNPQFCCGEKFGWRNAVYVCLEPNPNSNLWSRPFLIFRYATSVARKIKSHWSFWCMDCNGWSFVSLGVFALGLLCFGSYWFGTFVICFEGRKGESNAIIWEKARSINLYFFFCFYTSFFSFLFLVDGLS